MSQIMKHFASMVDELISPPYSDERTYVLTDIITGEMFAQAELTDGVALALNNNLQESNSLRLWLLGGTA